MSVVGLHDLLHQLVAHHVGLVEVHEAEPFDILDDLQRLHEPGHFRIRQIDLPRGATSGLLEARRVLADIPGIEFVYFDERDVVRHPTVQQIIRAYESYENRSRRVEPDADGKQQEPRG